MKPYIYLAILLGIIGLWQTSCAKSYIKNRPTKIFNTKARVVIDAGHGGEDSGAVSKNGLKEKDLTLDIARRLKKLFNLYMPNVEVVMTRSTDTYVSLKERLRIANEKPSDMFISIHINSSEQKSAFGFEIFSLDVASDRHAERLAARENQKIDSKSDVDFIRADLLAFSHRKDSDVLARSVALALKSQMAKIVKKELCDRGYNQAIFHVLFVKMPAILAELFFISNEEEEKILAHATAREHMARGLFLGAKNFFEHYKKKTADARK